MDTNNPLLAIEDLAAFDAIRPAQVEPAITALLTRAEAALEQAVDPATSVDYDTLATILDVATERLGRAWSAVRSTSSRQLVWVE